MTTFFWIIEYIASFIEIFMCCVFCGAFLVKEEFGDRKYLAFAGAALSALLITGLNKIEIFSVFNSIFVLFVIILFQLFLYKAKIGLCIVLPLIYAVILAAIDFASRCKLFIESSKFFKSFVYLAVKILVDINSSYTA